MRLITRLLTALFLFLFSALTVHAGEVTETFGWVSGLTPPETLAVNNDDFIGTAEANPNKFVLNNFNDAFPDDDFVQELYRLERIVPTKDSGGTTEYAVQIAAAHGSEDGTLDTQFRLELGFGTGDRFVSAADVAPLLSFDTPTDVSPGIPNYGFLPDDPYPTLKLIAHQGSSLLYQGSSIGSSFFGDGGTVEVTSFFSFDVFQFPLDVPDLPESARDFYTASELEGLSATEVPFTIRVTPVPEPSGLALLLTSLTLIGFYRVPRTRTAT